MGCTGSRAYDPPKPEPQNEAPMQFAIASTKKAPAQKKEKIPDTAHAFRVKCWGVDPLDEKHYDPVYFLEMPYTEEEMEAVKDPEKLQKIKSDPWKLIAKTKHKQTKHDVKNQPERDLLCYKNRMTNNTLLRISAYGWTGEPDVYKRNLLAEVTVTRQKLIGQVDTQDPRFYAPVKFAAGHRNTPERARILKDKGAHIIIRAYNSEAKERAKKNSDAASPSTTAMAEGNKPPQKQNSRSNMTPVTTPTTTAPKKQGSTGNMNSNNSSPNTTNTNPSAAAVAKSPSRKLNVNAPPRTPTSKSRSMLDIVDEEGDNEDSPGKGKLKKQASNKRKTQTDEKQN